MKKFKKILEIFGIDIVSLILFIVLNENLPSYFSVYYSPISIITVTILIYKICINLLKSSKQFIFKINYIAIVNVIVMSFIFMNITYTSSVFPLGGFSDDLSIHIFLIGIVFLILNAIAHLLFNIFKVLKKRFLNKK
ncbi:MAG: hypothetical protein NC253_07365 [Ruminococcus sp.]|nr:hypothetical protein [Ruminococcus sp.]MCM1478591.1 hypothetical protein [Muribaculaceae bacterium]